MLVLIGLAGGIFEGVFFQQTKALMKCRRLVTRAGNPS
jgi:hypothetical protein